VSRIKTGVEISQLLEISRNRNRPKKDDPFESVPLEHGMTMYIDTRVGFNKVKPMQSMLLGYQHGQYLILSTPRIDGMPIKYNETNLVNVYFIHNRTVFSFKSKVMRFLGPPFYLTIFQSPDALEETPLRSSSRIQVGIPFDRANGDPEREFIINLSATGALLKLSSKMPINSDISLSFFLPNGVAVNDIDCTVKRVDMSGGRMLAGVEFDDQHDDYPAIQRYMNFVMGAMEIKDKGFEEATARNKKKPEVVRKFG